LAGSASRLLVPVLASFVLAGQAGWAETRFEESPTVTDVALTAGPVRWEIQPGLVVDGWGYNGQVPGPELRVHEGDLVRVHLHNALPVPTTIHWHGIDVPFEQDGVPGLTQPAVEPGSDFTYEFIASNPGTRWYHSHVDGNSQLELGLYGPLIVEPRDPEPIEYAREYTYILDEKALDFTPQVALGSAQLRHQDAGNGRGGAVQYDAFLLNGKAGDAIPPLHIRVGETIRVRLINAGNLVHAIHLHGHSFTLVATDGNPVPPAAQLVKDTVLIGPAERYDLAIEGTNPGIWMFHCHMPNHQDNGMMTTLVYDDFSPTIGHDSGAAHPPPDPPAAPTPLASVAGSAEMIRVVDNRFEPPTTRVPVGTTISWSNAGLNRHTATAFEAGFDTGDIAPGSTTHLTLDRPGTYRYYCRQHLLSGMLGTLEVE
jgi:FtsP/CotA-like multicopper oxidase with cupredoxin domain